MLLIKYRFTFSWIVKWGMYINSNCLLFVYYCSGSEIAGYFLSSAFYNIHSSFWLWGYFLFQHANSLTTRLCQILTYTSLDTESISFFNIHSLFLWGYFLFQHAISLDKGYFLFQHTFSLTLRLLLNQHRGYSAAYITNAVRGKNDSLNCPANAYLHFLTIIINRWQVAKTYT